MTWEGADLKTGCLFLSSEEYYQGVEKSCQAKKTERREDVLLQEENHQGSVLLILAYWDITFVVILVLF